MRALDQGRRDRIGDALTWLCSAALAVNLVLILGLVALLTVEGLGRFWQRPFDELLLSDGSRVLGARVERERIPDAGPAADGRPAMRWRVKVANRDFTGSDYRWIDESSIVEQHRPRDVVLFERLEWGDFHGRLRAVKLADGTTTTGEDSFDALRRLLQKKRELRDGIAALQKGELGELDRSLERLRLAGRRLDLAPLAEPEGSRRREQIADETALLQSEYAVLADRLDQMRRSLEMDSVEVETADGVTRELPAGGVLRVVRPNALSWSGAIALYVDRVREFVADDPRESNTEGGIFPAIFGTVMMVFLMSLVVTPFGVIAAVYLHEYAKDGWRVRAVRIAVNNLAGVPSIVFGVFGLGFFVYGIGGTIDRLFFADALPTPTFGTGGILWASLTLALLTVPVVIVSSEEGLASVSRSVREASLALGATKFETLWRVVLPAAAPGVLTGVILALARAAGEVAPLMIVGMVKLAPSLPIDGSFPFFHLERKFMHLGFHIYDVGFQSPNVEAAKPLVFSTALLLVVVVLVTNLTAISLRNRLRRKYAARGL